MNDCGKKAKKDLNFASGDLENIANSEWEGARDQVRTLHELSTEDEKKSNCAARADCKVKFNFVVRLKVPAFGCMAARVSGVGQVI